MYAAISDTKNTLRQKFKNTFAKYGMGAVKRSKELYLIVQASITYKGAILQCNVVCLYTQQEHETMFKKKINSLLAKISIFSVMSNMLMSIHFYIYLPGQLYVHISLNMYSFSLGAITVAKFNVLALPPRFRAIVFPYCSHIYRGHP